MNLELQTLFSGTKFVGIRKDMINFAGQFEILV